MRANSAPARTRSPTSANMPATRPPSPSALSAASSRAAMAPVKVTVSSRSDARTASTVTKGSGVLSPEGRESNFSRVKPRPINRARIPRVQRMFRGMLERKLEDMGYQSVQ